MFLFEDYFDYFKDYFDYFDFDDFDDYLDFVYDFVYDWDWVVVFDLIGPFLILRLIDLLSICEI